MVKPKLDITHVALQPATIARLERARVAWLKETPSLNGMITKSAVIRRAIDLGLDALEKDTSAGAKR